jgi:hypothetical protein
MSNTSNNNNKRLTITLTGNKDYIEKLMKTTSFLQDMEHHVDSYGDQIDWQDQEPVIDWNLRFKVGSLPEKIYLNDYPQATILNKEVVG